MPTIVHARPRSSLRHSIEPLALVQIILIRMVGCPLGCIDNGTFMVPGHERIQALTVFSSITTRVPANLFSGLRAMRYISISGERDDAAGGLPQALFSLMNAANFIL
jgi:hypothetical protein